MSWLRNKWQEDSWLVLLPLLFVPYGLTFWLLWFLKVGTPR